MKIFWISSKGRKLFENVQLDQESYELEPWKAYAAIYLFLPHCSTWYIVSFILNPLTPSKFWFFCSLKCFSDAAITSKSFIQKFPSLSNSLSGWKTGNSWMENYLVSRVFTHRNTKFFKISNILPADIFSCKRRTPFCSFPHWFFLFNRYSKLD